MEIILHVLSISQGYLEKQRRQWLLKAFTALKCSLRLVYVLELQAKAKMRGQSTEWHSSSVHSLGLPEGAVEEERSWVCAESSLHVSAHNSHSSTVVLILW